MKQRAMLRNHTYTNLNIAARQQNMNAKGES